ncbi:MAG: hypothetical protein WCF65_07110 [Parachlamydiaceae bacterium]
MISTLYTRIFVVVIFSVPLFIPSFITSLELMKDYLDYSEERPLPTLANDLVYGEGTTEVTSQINEYDNIVANTPIHGSIFVTHDVQNVIDISSFRLGTDALTVKFVETSQMSSPSNIVVSIYSFLLEGFPTGIHTLPPINVRVGGREVQALPLVIEVSAN